MNNKGWFKDGNQYAYGNAGGGRKGYEFEKDQLVRMRKAVDRALWTLEAIQKGKASDKMLSRYQKIQPTLVKLIDKLHATKIEQSGEITLRPTPIYSGMSVQTIDGSVVEQLPENNEKNISTQ